MNIREWLLLSPFYDLFGKRSFAQAGEDILVDVQLGKKRKGVYIDVGAYHPKLFSNTYLFYKRGWRGLCIDPNPKMEAMHRKVRGRDSFLNLGVGGKESVMDYYIFDDGATNTFSTEQAEKNQKEAGRKLREVKKVGVLPLKKIIKDWLKEEEVIDLLSIDAEGMDEEILRSNDWKKYRPKVIVCEDLEYDFKDYKKSRVAKLLVEEGYRLCGMTSYSLAFVLE